MEKAAAKPQAPWAIWLQTQVSYHKWKNTQLHLGSNVLLTSDMFFFFFFLL